MTGTTWTDVSDNISVVEPPTWTRMTAEAYVYGETAPLTVVGKAEPVELTLRGIWVEGTADPFYTTYAQFTAACSGMVAVRWAPAGCTTAHDAFYTSTTKSVVSSLTFPSGDSASADIIMWEAVIRSPDITRATWS